VTPANRDTSNRDTSNRDTSNRDASKRRQAEEGSVVPNDSDEEFGALLNSALRADLEPIQVDVAALVTGSRHRARRLRARRIAAVSVAAVLAVGVPAGIEIFRPAAGQGPPAALLPSHHYSGAHPPRGMQTIAPPVPVVTPGSAELPQGLILREKTDMAQMTGLPELAVVGGQECRPSITGPHAVRNGTFVPGIVSRQWIWSAAPSGPTALTVNLILTRWPGQAGAAARFHELTNDSGPCAWSRPQTVTQFTAAGSDQSWSATSSGDAGNYGRAVARVGDLIAGVEVQDPAGSPAALALAQRLAEREVEHLAGKS
jgi:hypothetical protein